MGGSSAPQCCLPMWPQKRGQLNISSATISYIAYMLRTYGILRILKLFPLPGECHGIHLQLSLEGTGSEAHLQAQHAESRNRGVLTLFSALQDYYMYTTTQHIRSINIFSPQALAAFLRQRSCATPSPAICPYRSRATTPDSSCMPRPSSCHHLQDH